MNYLLDTHTWVWSQETPEKLGPKARRSLTDARHRLYVSTISTLEIARLVGGGFIELSGTLDNWVSKSLDSLMCNTVEISHEIALGAYALPSGFHKDPVDRVIVATARIYHLTVLTADDRILKYRDVHGQDAGH